MLREQLFSTFADDVRTSLEAGGTTVGTAVPVTEISTGDIFTANEAPALGKAIWYGVVGKTGDNEAPNIVLQNLVWGVGSTDSGQSFNESGNQLTGVNYSDFDTFRGFLYGPNGVYDGGVGDDIEVFDGSVPVNYMLLAPAFGQSVFGDESDLGYLNGEVEFQIEASFVLFNQFGAPQFGDTADVSVTGTSDYSTVVPTPSALAIGLVGLTVMALRRQRV